MYLRAMCPASQFAYAWGKIVSSTCVAMILGGPLAALVLSACAGGAPNGWEAWQWIFVLQGAPAVALGLLLPCLLPASPAALGLGAGPDAEEVKQLYLDCLAAEGLNAGAAGGGDEEDGAPAQQQRQRRPGCRTLCQMCGDRRFWAFGLSSFLSGAGFWGIVFWIPRVVDNVSEAWHDDHPHERWVEGNATAYAALVGEGLVPGAADGAAGTALTAPVNGTAAGAALEAAATKAFVGLSLEYESDGARALQLTLLLCAVPYTGAVLGTLLNSWHSDATRERPGHVMAALTTGAFGLFLTQQTLRRPIANLISLTVTAFGFWGISGPFWGYVNEYTPEEAVAAVLAPMINSAGSMGGIVGPVIVGYIYENTDSYRPALVLLCFMTICAMFPLCCMLPPKPDFRDFSSAKRRPMPMH